MEKISTGAEFLDAFLEGGYDKDIVTTIYGPSGSGKTNLCLIAAVNIVNSGKKVIFIDTEGGIAVERIKQIDNSLSLDNFLFFNPFSFDDQKEVFDNLEVCDKIGLVIVDSISMLYRLELGSKEEVYEVNSSLGKQIACLVGIARKHKIPVLVTSQVYADFGNPDSVKIVGGDLLKYGSKCLLELKKLHDGRCIILRKHRYLPEGIGCMFKIVREGIVEVKSSINS